VALLGLVVVAAACGHRTDTDELVAANSKVTERTTEAGTPTGDGGVAVGVIDPADPAAGGTGGTTGATTGGSTGGTAGGTTEGTTGGTTGGGTAGPSCAGTPKQTGPVTIGSVGNYSGIAGPPQAPMVRAVQVWAEWINSTGGLCGRPVQVVVVDDRGDPAQHVAGLRNLVENRKVVAFVANAGALTIASGKTYLESAGVPVIGTACANTTEYESTIMFPQCEDVTDFFGRNVALGVEFTGQKDYGFFTCTEAQTCTDGFNKVIGSGAATRAGANVKYSGRGSLAQPDFTSECQTAKAQGVKLMQVVLDPTGVIRFGQSCARQDFNPVFVQGSATVFYNTKDQPGFGSLIVGSQVFSFVGQETPARKQFHDVMRTFYGKPAGPGEAYGWAAAKLFEHVAGIAATNAGELTPKSLIDALHTLEGETLGGLTVPLTFPAGRPAQPAKCVFGAQVQDGEWRPLNGGEPLCG
jgi:branched-chain amino acid transport system substrate-binding protein